MGGSVASVRVHFSLLLLSLGISFGGSILSQYSPYVRIITDELCQPAETQSRAEIV